MALERFNIESIRGKHLFVGVYGKKRSGKTTLIKHLIQDHAHSVMTQDPHLFPRASFTSTSFKCGDLQHIVDTQRLASKRAKLGQLKDVASHWVAIEDTVYNGKQLCECHAVMDTAEPGLKMGIAYVSHYPFPLAPFIVSRMDYVFVFRLVHIPTYEKCLRTLYDMYFQPWIAYPDFFDMYEEITREAYTCLVLCIRDGRMGWCRLNTYDSSENNAATS